MLDVRKNKNSFGYDVFYIKTTEGEFEISFQNNLDLYFRYVYRGNILEQSGMHEFTITKENYIIYQMFDKLFNDIKNNITESSTLLKNGVID